LPTRLVNLESVHQYCSWTKIAGQSLQQYLKRRVLDPIGVTQFGWEADSTGKVPNWTGGIKISASNLARFGHLFLNQGSWDGKQLVPAAWVREATRVQVTLLHLDSDENNLPSLTIVVAERMASGGRETPDSSARSRVQDVCSVSTGGDVPIVVCCIAFDASIRGLTPAARQEEMKGLRESSPRARFSTRFRRPGHQLFDDPSHLVR
jgi:hypothetical protein